MQTVTSADDTSIAYERHGHGAPLVLVHGGSRPDFWRPVLPAFADDYEVLLVHRRGHGESGHSDAHTLQREVEDVRAVVDAADGDPVLFGHSFGGLLAIEAAREASVRALAAYEPAVLVGEYREQADLAARMQSLLDDGQRRQAMREYVGEVVHTGDPDDLEGWLAEWPPWPDIVALAEQTTRTNRAIEQYQLPDALAVDAPTLLLTGTEGPPHLRDGIRAVRGALPEPEFVEFDGVSHAGPGEAPERVADAVTSFAEGARSPVSQS